MSRFQTYRVLVRKFELHAIDIAARSDNDAIGRAEWLWNRNERSAFHRILACEPELFEIDQCCARELPAVDSDDRARWAERALRNFARDTGSGIGPEAVHDLICDLGHYADTLALDFRAELERAAAVWAEERHDEAATRR